MVAMVISRVADRMASDLPEGDDRYELVAQRIEALVRDGRLVAQGDIKKWRLAKLGGQISPSVQNRFSLFFI